MPREAGDKEGSFLSPAPVFLLGCKLVKDTEPGEGNSKHCGPRHLGPGRLSAFCSPFSALKMLPSPKHPHTPNYSAQQSKLNASIFSSYSCVLSPCSGVSWFTAEKQLYFDLRFRAQGLSQAYVFSSPRGPPQPSPLSLRHWPEAASPAGPCLSPGSVAAPVSPHPFQWSLTCPVCFPQPLNCRTSLGFIFRLLSSSC